MTLLNNSSEERVGQGYRVKSENKRSLLPQIYSVKTQKTRSNPPKKSKKNEQGLVIGGVWFLKMENP